MSAQLLGESDTAFHVKQPNGALMTLPKNAVSMQFANQLRALPTAEGGFSQKPLSPTQMAMMPPEDVPPPPQPVPPPEPQGMPITAAATMQAPVPETGQGYGGSGVMEALQTQNARTQGALSGDLQDARRAMGKQRRAIEAQGEAQAEGVEAAAGEMAKSNAELAAFDTQQQARAAQLQALTQKEMQKLGALNADLATMKVDPGRLMGEKGTGGQIAAAIMAGLGALGSAMSGGPNQALAIINGAIDRDIDAQRTAIETKKSQIAERTNILGMTRAMFDDQRQQDAATRMTMLDMAKRKVDQLAMASKAPEVRANAEALKAQIDLQGSQLAKEFHTISGQLANQNLSQQVEAEGRQLAYSASLAKNSADAAAEQRKAAAEASKHNIPGLIGSARTEHGYGKAAEMQAAYQQLLPLVARLKEHVAATKGKLVIPKSDLDQAGKSLATQIHLKLKGLEGLGVLSGPDMELLSKVIPEDPSKFVSSTPRQIEEFEKGLESSANAYLNAYGYIGREQIPGGISDTETPASSTSSPAGSVKTAMAR